MVWFIACIHVQVCLLCLEHTHTHIHFHTHTHTHICTRTHMHTIMTRTHATFVLFYFLTSLARTHTQRDHSLGEHMCAFDELGIDTDGTSRQRTLGVKEKTKRVGWCCLCVLVCACVACLLVLVVLLLLFFWFDLFYSLARVQKSSCKLVNLWIEKATQKPYAWLLVCFAGRT